MTTNRSYTSSLHRQTLDLKQKDHVEYRLDFIDPSTGTTTIENTLPQNFEENAENDPLPQHLFPCTGYTTVSSLISNNDGNIVAGFYIMGDFSNLAFDPVSQQWQRRPFLPRFRTNHKAVKTKKYIWLFGGVSTTTTTINNNNGNNNNNNKQLEFAVKEIDIYHVLYNKWITLSPSSPLFPFFWINDDQQDIAIVEAFVLDDTNIYILTYNHNNHTNQMWMINSDNLLSQYHHQQSSTETTHQPTTTLVHNNNAILPRVPMTIPRAAGVTLKPLMSRYVFAIGGNVHADEHTSTTTSSLNENQQLSNIDNNRVEVYDAKYNQWATLRKSLMHTRSFANVLIFNDILYVFGGDQNTPSGTFTFSSSSWAERYDPHLGISGSWEHVRTSFPSTSLTWDYLTIMASSQLQTWYLLASQKAKQNENSSSYLCQHKLYISHQPQQKSVTAWTIAKHSIQDYMSDSIQKHENGGNSKAFIIGALFITCSVFIIIPALCCCYLRRRYQRQQTQIEIQEQFPLSISEFELT